MENELLLEKIAEHFGQNNLVKDVFGTPVTAGDKTIIPVTEIAFGFGGGYGQKNNGKEINPAEAKSIRQTDINLYGEGGAGGGGGMYIKPKGVYEVTPTGTRFIQSRSNMQLIAGICIGLLLRGLFSARRRNKIKWNNTHLFVKK